MLARARAAADAAGLATSRGASRLVEGDARDGPPRPTPAPTGWRSIPLNSLFLMGTRRRPGRRRRDARRAPRAGRPRGRRRVAPDADDLSRYDGRLSLEWVREEPGTGRTVTKTGSAIYDPASSVVRLTTIFEAAAPGEAAVALGARGPAPARRAGRPGGLRRGGGPRRRGARGRLRPRPAGARARSASSWSPGAPDHPSGAGRRAPAITRAVRGDGTIGAGQGARPAW